MSGYKSTFLANAVLDKILSATDFTPPGTLYVALFTTLPAADGTGGVEVSGGSYARLAVTNNNTNFPGASSGAKVNGTAWTWDAPTANWGTLVGCALMSASSGGDMYYVMEFSVAYPVNDGDPAFAIAAGAAQFTEA